MAQNNTIESLKRENEFLSEQLEWFMKENRYNLEKRLEEQKMRFKHCKRETERFWKMFNDLQELRKTINQQQIIINNHKNDNTTRTN